MHLSLKSFAAGAAAMLVLGTGSAVAATGAHLIIGKHNDEKSTTTISDSRGTPLSLKAPRSKAPLAVSNDKLVKHLNADYLDGISSKGYALKGAGTAEYSAGAPVPVDLNGDGTNDATMSTVACPKGTIATGTGVWNAGNYPVEDLELVDAFPSPKGDGVADTAVALTPDVGSNGPTSAIQFSVDVICFNPRGKVPTQPTSTAAASAATGAQARREAIRRELPSLAAAALER